MDIETIIRNVYISLLVPKGSFKLNQELGSKMPSPIIKNWDYFCFEFKRILDEILLDFIDVSYKNIVYEKTECGAKVTVLLSVADEEEFATFNFYDEGKAEYGNEEK